MDEDGEMVPGEKPFCYIDFGATNTTEGQLRVELFKYYR